MKTPIPRSKMLDLKKRLDRLRDNPQSPVKREFVWSPLLKAWRNKKTGEVRTHLFVRKSTLGAAAFTK